MHFSAKLWYNFMPLHSALVGPLARSEVPVPKPGLVCVLSIIEVGRYILKISLIYH